MGLLGLGTVGGGVTRVLARNAGEISRRAGREIVITHAAARNLDSTTANTAGVLAGRTGGVHLDEKGREQAARAGARLAGAFERTASRLTEMQSTGYLGRSHL